MCQDSDEGKYLKDIEKLLKDTIPAAEAPEDLEGDIKAIRARKALPKPEKPQQETRKGRGKSKKKKKARGRKKRGRPVKAAPEKRPPKTESLVMESQVGANRAR